VQRMGEIYIDSRFRGNDKESWSGSCRVDVVAVVLENDGSVERIEHYQAVY